MEHEPILVDEFPISDDPASEGTQIPPELEAGGSRSPPPRSRGDLIPPPEVIASAAARFKKRRRIQSLAAEVSASLSIFGPDVQRELRLSFGFGCPNGL